MTCPSALNKVIKALLSNVTFYIWHIVIKHYNVEA